MANYDNIVTDRNNLANIFYPIGTYYETIKSTSEFDPNVVWPDTVWELETAGKVHVSAGTDYTIGNAGGNMSVSYTPTGVINGTPVSLESQIASHSHGSSGAKTVILYGRGYRNNSTVGITVTEMLWNVSNTTQTYTSDSDSGARLYNTKGVVDMSGATNVITFNNVHGHGSAGGGAVHTHPKSGGTVTGSTINLNTEQAYITVNRWHRVG